VQRSNDELWHNPTHRLVAAASLFCFWFHPETFFEIKFLLINKEEPTFDNYIKITVNHTNGNYFGPCESFIHHFEKSSFGNNTSLLSCLQKLISH